MAYPSGILFRPKSSNIGFQPIDEATSDARHPLGSTVVAEDITLGTAQFIYLKGAASTSKGDLVAFDQANSTTRAGAGVTGPAAVAMSDCGAGQYGWYAIQGKVPLKTPNAVASGGAAFPTSTAGGADDLDALGLQLSGASFKAADSGGFAYAQLSRPTIQTSTGAVERWPKPALSQPTTNAQSVGVVGRVFLGLFEIQKLCRVDAVVVMSGMASPAGNITVGIYGPIPTEDTCAAAPLVSQSASTTLTATSSNPQAISLTTTPNLAPGRYYVAYEADATTVLVQRHTNNREVPGAWQYYNRSGGYGALTDPAPTVLDQTSSSTDNPVLRPRCIAPA